MLASITPLGERGRGNRYGTTVTALLIGSVAGGVALGAALGTLGQAVGALAPDGALGPAVSLGVLAMVGLVGLAADLGIGGLRLPTIHRQVSEDWLDQYRGWVYGLGFGAQLGFGVATIVTASATYVAFAAALLTQSWVGGALVGAAFGLARALPVLATARVRHPGALAAVHRRSHRLAGTAHRTVLAAQGTMVVVAVVLASVLAASQG